MIAVHREVLTVPGSNRMSGSKSLQIALPSVNRGTAVLLSDGYTDLQSLGSLSEN